MSSELIWEGRCEWRLLNECKIAMAMELVMAFHCWNLQTAATVTRNARFCRFTEREKGKGCKIEQDCQRWRPEKCSTCCFHHRWPVPVPCLCVNLNFLQDSPALWTLDWESSAHDIVAMQASQWIKLTGTRTLAVLWFSSNEKTTVAPLASQVQLVHTGVVDHIR